MVLNDKLDLDADLFWESDRRLISETFRPLSVIAKDLGFVGKDDLLNFIGKQERVVDLGSGYDGLALGCLMEGVNTLIISVNPRRKLPNFKEGRLKTIMAKLDNKHPQEFIEKLLEKVDILATAEYAENLASLPSNSVDLVIDNQAISYYLHDDPMAAAPTWRAYLDESLRVLRPEGIMLIGDHTMFRALRTVLKPWRIAVLSGLENVRYEIIPKDLGVKLVKLA